MSENKFDLNVKVDVPEQAVDAVATPMKNLLNPIAKSIGDGLGDMIDYIFSPFKYMSEERKLRYDHELKSLKNELGNEINNIPEDKLCEPDLQTVGTALENAKFCIESDELRAMFVKLISKSINSDTKNIAHPGFSEIIKQMTPNEAKMLSFFSDKSQYSICEFRLKTETGYRIALTNIMIMPDQTNDIESNAISISNLNRLGLLELTYDKHITDEIFYNDYNDFLKEYIKGNSFDYEVTMEKGIAIVTPLGQQFIEVCISD